MGFALPLGCRVGSALALGCLRPYAPVGLSRKPRDPVEMPKNPLGLRWGET